MNKLDQVVTNNIKTNKYQLNDAIHNEPTFDTSRFNSYKGTREPLPVVNITPLGGRKHRSMTVSGLTYLWDSGDTDSTIKRKHTKYYERKMRYNKVEYSTAAGIYCTMHDVKVHFCMPYFFIIKIINHHFHVNNDEEKLGIGYDMIIGRNLMVQIGLAADFKRQFI